MFNRVCLAAVLSLSVFCALAKPAEVPTPVAQDLPVELIEAQQEIGVTVSQTASAVGMQFGLIGAIIGSAVQNSQAKKAEEAVVPLRNLLVDYHFNQRVQDVLQPKLVSGGLSPNPTLTVMPTAWEAHDAQQSAKLPPYAMVLTPRYSMDSDFSVLSVNLLVQVVDRTVKSNGKIKAVPRVSHNYSFHFPMQGARSEDPVQDWVALGSAGLAQLLEQGIAQTTDMLVQDFSAEGRSWWNTKPPVESVSVGGTLYKGQSVRKGEGWAWVRTGKGFMQAVQGYQPLTAGVLPAMPEIATATVVAAAPAPAPVPAPAPAPAVDAAAPVAATETSAPATPVAPAAAPASAEPSTPETPAAPAVDSEAAAPVGG